MTPSNNSKLALCSAFNEAYEQYTNLSYLLGSLIEIKAWEATGHKSLGDMLHEMETAPDSYPSVSDELHLILSYSSTVLRMFRAEVPESIEDKQRRAERMAWQLAALQREIAEAQAGGAQ